MTNQVDTNKLDTSSADQTNWPPLELVSSPVTYNIAMNEGDALGAAPATATDQLASYQKWNRWLVTGAGFIKTVDAIVTKEISNPKAKTAVDAACRAFYLAAGGMNNEVVAAIKDLGQTPPVEPTVQFDPLSLPDWPSQGSPNLFGSIWETAKPLIEDLDEKLQKSHPGAPIVVALAGLMNAGDQVVSALSAAYPSA